MEGQNRRVRKYIKCSTCKVFDLILIDPAITRLKCHNCKQLLKEISEAEYKQLKQKAKEVKERRERERNYQQNNNHNRINVPSSNENNNRDRDRGRGNSSLHYSRMNINNVEERNDNHINNNMNNNNINRRNQNNNNINRNQNNNNNNPNRPHIRVININNINNRHRGHNHQNNRRRDHSSERNNNNNNIFEHIMGNILRPFSNMGGNPVIIGNSNNRNPFRIVVQRQNVPHDIFDPFFSNFGSVFNGVFQDNFSSNFRSNYRGNFINEILGILQQNQAESRRHAHPPTSNENLNKLKKFDMNEKYCKKEKDGKVEVPNCCICLDEISMGEKTVLLPCGHMFHSDCIITWLKKNNTCPMCRFEIK